MVSPKKVRLIIIEDNRILRVGITAMVNGQPDMKVVAAIGSGNNVLLNVREQKPHAVLLDLGLTHHNPRHLLEVLRDEFPEVKIIGMGLIPPQADIIESVEAGASGFILKDATVKDFLSTIRAVVRGGKVLPPLLTGSLFSRVIEQALKNGKGSVTTAVRMTKREREIIALIADGMSNKEIAQRLNVATHTVKSHVHNILEKLALHSRLQIATFTHNEKRL